MADTILVVDDDPETVRLMQLFLRRQGYNTLGAHSGALAIELARKEQPDLIILDVMMPGMDGIETSRSLHHLPETATIPVLMVTARASNEDKTRGYDAGADIYLTKPVHSADLTHNIQALLEQRETRKSRLNSNAYTVGVIGAKGGVGASTVALNLSAQLARIPGSPLRPSPSGSLRLPGRVAAAELRPGQGVWADELRLDGAGALGQLLRLQLGEITHAAVEGMLTTTTFDTRLLLAGNLSAEPVYHKNLAQYDAILDGLRAAAELVVLDAGQYSSEIVTNMLDACSELVLVIEPDELTVRRAARMIELLRKHGFGAARPLNIVSVNRGMNVMMSVSQIENTLSRPVALGIPPAQELAAYAQRQMLPASLAQPDSLVAQQYARLAEIVRAHVAAMINP